MIKIELRISLFLVLAAVLLLACNGEAPGLQSGKNVAQKPEPVATVSVIHNARIYTVNKHQALVEAMAFDDSGQILALGSNQKIQSAYQAAVSIDLQGKTVIPGLIDSHGHLSGLALSLTRAQLDGTKSKQEIFQRLKAHEQSLAENDWLLGRGWDQNDWPVQEFPTRDDLDEHFPDRPVWLVRVDGHAAWGNSAALAMADRDLTGDWHPEGGYIHRDESQQPTGVFIDNARSLVENIVPGESEQLLDEALGLALQRMVSLGLTGVHDPGISRSVIERYIRFIEAGRFSTRVYAMAGGAGKTLDWLCKQGGIEHESGRLLARSAKLYEDGAMGSRGAAMLDEYADDPGNRGLLFLQPEALQEQVKSVLSCGFQVAVHAIGDLANRVVLDVLEAEIALHPDNPGRHRIEHVQILSEEDVLRFAEMEIIAAMQPTHATSDMYWVENRLGPERIHYAYAWRSLLNSGARLALGSDFPVERVNPMHGIYAAVSRRDLEGWPQGGWYPAEAISRTEALRGFTLDAAFAGFMEDQVGSLEAGKRADFLVLDRDIMSVAEDEIPQTRVIETWLDGVRVFLAEIPPINSADAVE